MPGFDRTCLVLGGARSGKSRFAEALAEARPGPLVYLATAEARDAEMAARVEAHRERRGTRWTTIEAPIDLAEAIEVHARADATILVDCLTLWVSNLMERERDVELAGDGLCRALASAPGAVVLVSNEVGMGLVPMHPLGRQFRDAAGVLSQKVAASVDTAWLVVAGLPLRLKPQGNA